MILIKAQSLISPNGDQFQSVLSPFKALSHNIPNHNTGKDYFSLYLIIQKRCYFVYLIC